jgi:sugar lactone lactonase YvrE
MALMVMTLHAACTPNEDTGKTPEDTACALESGTVCRVAGTGAPGAIETATDALESPLYGPMDVAAFTGSDDFLIADWNNHKIRRVQNGAVQTILGTVFLGDGDPDFHEREPPGVDGTLVALNHPTSMEWNPVTEQWLLPSWHNHRVRQWAPETGLSLVVVADTDIADGNGANSGFAGDGGPASGALMSYPNSIAVNPNSGDFWIVDQRNNRIRSVAADFSIIDTVAGGDEAEWSGDDGPAEDARFFFWYPEELQPEPSGAIEFDPERNQLYVADTSNHRIRAIDVETGTIRSLNIASEQTLPDGQCDPEALCFPRDVEVDGNRLYIADTNNHVIRVFDLETGDLSLVAGAFEAGPTSMNDDALLATLNTPHGIDIAPDGSVLIADTYNHQILRVNP